MTSRAVLDHVAIAATDMTDGWHLFGGLLGGSWVYGDDSPGFWWGQLRGQATRLARRLAVSVQLGP
jgi:hypothetical protein